MAEAPSPCSSSSRKHKKAIDIDGHLITESDMEAAQQLMQLSDEENSNNIKSGKKKRRSFDDEEEVDQRPNDIVMAKIQEIFGKDIEDFPAKKQRRYRSLVNIYMATRPVNAAAGNGRRVKA